jgi:hypothetical protein
MKRHIRLLGSALFFSFIASAASAADIIGDTYLFQFDDSTEAGLIASTYLNGGACVQCVTLGGESYPGGYGLFEPAGVDPFANPSLLAQDVNVQVNILDANGTLSDTWSITGLRGDQALQIPFFSDVEGQTLTPLDTLNFLTETGDWQTVAEFDAITALGTTDHYIFQFRSDIDAVPEPLTLSLFGAGLAGAVAVRRRKKKAA